MEASAPLQSKNLISLFDRLKYLTAQKISQEKQWIDTKALAYHSSSITKPIHHFDYAPLEKLDEEQEKVLGKFEKELSDYIQNISSTIAAELSLKLTKLFRAHLLETYKMLPDIYHRGKWSVTDSVGPDKALKLRFEPDDKGQDEMAIERLELALQDLSDWLNKIQGSLNVIKSGGTAAKGKAKRRRAKPYLPLQQIINGDEKWIRFIKLCDYFCQERTYSGYDIQIIRKIETRYFWLGKNQGAGLPQLAAFMHSLYQADYIIPQERMAMCRSFLAFFNLKEKDSKYLGREFKYPCPFFTEVFTKKINDSKFFSS